VVDSKYYLYKLTNSLESILYIGITNNPKRRFREHLLNPTNSKLKSYIKNNKDLNIQVLCIGSLDYIAELEIVLIKKYRESNFNIVNYMDGGQSPSGIKGKDHWNCILSEDTIVLLRELYASGQYTQRALSIVFNTGYKNISKIVRGERWKELGGPITIERQVVSKVANRAKLSEEDVVLLREVAMQLSKESRLNITELSGILEIDRHNISKVLTGVSWKSLTGPIKGVDYD